MAEPHLDHPGEISWFGWQGPLPVAGPCPHSDCPHDDTRVIAHGPDFRRYTLERCDVPGGCAGACRAWHNERGRASTPWLKVVREPR